MRTRTCVATLIVGVALTSCGNDDDKDKKLAKPARFSMTATVVSSNKLAIEHPATVKAGLVTLTLINQDDKRLRSAQIVRLLGNHTVDEFEAAVDKEGAKLPTWIKDGGGVSAVKPGETGTATQVLVPGKYAITDDEGGDENSPSNSELGARSEFTVTGPSVKADLPTQPSTITATDKNSTDDDSDEYKFKFKGLKAGANYVRFENTGDEFHHALFFPLNDGATLKDAETFFTSDNSKSPPPVDFAKGVGTVVIGGGNEQNIKLTLAPAKYAVICFIQDRKGGKPHVAQGMIEELTIPAPKSYPIDRPSGSRPG